MLHNEPLCYIVVDGEVTVIAEYWINWFEGTAVKEGQKGGASLEIFAPLKEWF